MSINVNFYSFAKKENSTKIPTGTPTTYACVLKDSCGILNPSIVLDLGATGNPASLNYAYISSFNRYYFIDEWNYNKGLWEASLRVDVLASYKAAIGSSTQYVLRAAQNTDWDGSIVDNYFPAKGFYNTIVDTKDSFWDVANATLILGVISSDSGGTITRGAVRYYALNSTQAKNFFDWMFNINNYAEGGTWQEISSDFAKILFNPFQYIASAYWLPFSVSGVSKSLKYGYWDSGITVTEVAADSYKWITGSFAVPQHPQASSRGVFLNQAPYSTYVIDFPPFGRIEIDSLIVGDAPRLYFGVAIDLQSGIGKLILSTKSTSGGVVDVNNVNIGIIDGQVGVPITLAQMQMNNPASMAVGVGSAITSIVTGNIAGAVSGIGSAINAAIPELQYSGSQGSVTNFYLGKPKFITRTLNIVDANDDRAGRPVCKEKVINTLSGYILCSDGELDLNATANELTQIRSYLTGGFFYE